MVETTDEKTVKGQGKPTAIANMSKETANALDILRSSYKSKKRSTRAKKVPTTVEFTICLTKLETTSGDRIRHRQAQARS